jgi:hypothetical protein
VRARLAVKVDRAKPPLISQKSKVGVWNFASGESEFYPDCPYRQVLGDRIPVTVANDGYPRESDERG